MSAKVVIEIKQTFSSFAPKLVLLSQESLWVELMEETRASRDIRQDPGTSSVPAIGRWPRSAGGELGRETLPQTPECQGEGSPLRTQKREFLSSKRPGHCPKR